MKGKKKDSKFINDFINECIINNKLTTDEIVKEAKNKISEIDIQLKNIESLKLTRSKLLDVLESFEHKEVKSNNDSLIISFFDIKNHNLCYDICKLLKNKNISINDLLGDQNKEDIIFCVKKMQELKIISKINDCLSKGKNFHEYMRVVFKDE